MSLIIFSHANSFPASTYRVLFKSLRARGHAVRAVEKFGHDPQYPVTSNWPHLVQQLADFAAPEIEAHGSGAWLVGHSLGGFLSLMCAARHPRLGGHPVKGVALIGDVARPAGSASMLNSQKLRELRHPDWGVARDELAKPPGWAPSFDLDSGFADAVAWYRAAGWLPG